MVSRRSVFGLFNNPQREAARLSRDAQTVVDMARQTYRAEGNREIALLTRAGIRQISELCGDDASCLEGELDRFKTLHQEAKRQLNQLALTAYTLIIINTRAGMLGQVGAPAIAAVQSFVDDWAHVDDEGTG